MEIKGRVIQILPASSGSSARGEWKRQDFILETEEQYPKKVCISNWNDKVDIDKLPKKALVTASINLESREYNGKWYTDVRVWKIRAESSNNSSSSENSIPPSTEAPPVEDDESDDLPF